jgi:ankyrin repeat protein
MIQHLLFLLFALTTEPIQLLLDAGTDVTVTDEGGSTALHLATEHSFVWAANALLRHQA